MDLTYASDLRLREAIVRKQSKYSLTARMAHDKTGELDTALPRPADYDTMSPARQREWNTSNYRTSDTSTGGTAECRLRNAGWRVEPRPTVVAMGMRGCVPNSNTGAYLELGIPKDAHARLDKDLHDLTVKHMQIMVNMQRKARRTWGRASGGPEPASRHE